MTDIFSPDKRSQIMASIKGKNTKSELMVFRYLRARKIYFQKHYRNTPIGGGTPDLALPRKKRAVFIDGEFWHGKTFDTLKKKYDVDNYWVKKIARNIERDSKQREILRDAGWQILVVWENDVRRKKTRQESLASIEKFLTEDGLSPR